MLTEAEKRANRNKNGLNFKQRILNALQESDFGLTPTQMADQLKIARATATKYLEELNVEGKILVHFVGPYSVYSIKHNGESSLYQSLYYGAVKGSALLASGYPHLNLQTIWNDLVDKVTIPYEDEITPVVGQPTPDYLERLMQIANNILSEFGYYSEFPKIEIIPPLGSQSPMTRLIRVIDPGFIEQGAEFHYYFLASLLQEKFTRRAGIPVVFRLTQDIQPQDTVIYIEIGFIESYYVDACIIEQRDTSKDPREFLDIITSYFGNYLRVKVREFELGNVLHYECKFLENREWEELFAIRAKTFRKNVELLRKFNLRPTRQWIPYEDWPEPPYLIVQFVTNLGFAFDDFHRAMREGYQVAGYCMHFEKIPNGIRMNFREKLDFDTLWTNFSSDEDIRELYRNFGIESEQYLVERKKALLEILEEMKKKRLEIRSRKHKNPGAKLNNYST